MDTKKILLLYVLIFPSICIFSQASVTISEYGVYFIDNGVVKNIPTTKKISFSVFWRNYIIFSDSTESFIYNTENGAMSDIFRSGDAFFPVASNNFNLLFHRSRTDYEINPVTLRTVATRAVPKRDYWEEKLHDYGDHLDMRVEYINDWEECYHGENFYLTVILSRHIPYYSDRYIDGGRKNQFVFIVNDTYTVK